MIHCANKCINIAKRLSQQTQRNINAFAELKLSLLFALLVKLPAGVILYILDVPSVVRHTLENLKVRIQQKQSSRLSRHAFFSLVVSRCECLMRADSGMDTESAFTWSRLSLCGKSLVTIELMDGQVRTIAQTETYTCQRPQTYQITLHQSHHPLGPYQFRSEI